ncbi:hypothetical protein [Mesobacillus foraminis]|uniref:hypothetical protein n=1 Tax=Mesobacillus foraminis TaxID=279826 RepID=UPI000EF4EFD7|nr:hypothetical protein [Mesobacillus foraminis]
MVDQLINKRIPYFILLLISFPFGIANIISSFQPDISIIALSFVILLIESILIYNKVYINFSNKEKSIDKAFWFYILFNLITSLLFMIWGIFYLSSGLSI